MKMIKYLINMNVIYSLLLYFTARYTSYLLPGLDDNLVTDYCRRMDLVILISVLVGLALPNIDWRVLMWAFIIFIFIGPLEIKLNCLINPAYEPIPIAFPDNIFNAIYCVAPLIFGRLLRLLLEWLDIKIRKYCPASAKP